MTSIELPAPAKVNLYLKVLNKRRDSYHTIFTVFERIALADGIRISKAPFGKGIRVRSDRSITKDPKENLVYRAAELIMRQANLESGVTIELEKRIPIAAGLGGGSSDAAATLKGMNRLFKLGLTVKALSALGRRLGADVPFFLLDAPFAVGRSRGDELEKVESKARLWHLLVYPGFEVSTKEIYNEYDMSKSLTERKSDATITRILKHPLDFDAAASMLYNDLEEAVRSRYGTIGRLLERLAHILGKKMIISGSGPSLFCLYRTRGEVMAAKERLLRSVPERERVRWRVFTVKTC